MLGVDPVGGAPHLQAAYDDPCCGDQHQDDGELRVIPVVAELIDDRPGALQLVVDGILQHRIPKEAGKLFPELVEEPEPGHDGDREHAGQERKEGHQSDGDRQGFPIGVEREPVQPPVDDRLDRVERFQCRIGPVQMRAKSHCRMSGMSG